jgi:thiamine-phosphate pyrophosphorylase
LSSTLIPRFYPILDTASANLRMLEIVSVANEILDAGASILQFRHKGVFSRQVFADLERVAELCRQAGATFVVNDRADIAKMVDAALHLGQEDLLPVDARSVTGDGTMIGFSTHNEAQLRSAESQPADYLAFGPIFGTSSKQNPDPTVGLEELRRLRPLTMRPLVAIGGITRANARSVVDAGADSVAVIGDLFPGRGSIRERAAEWIALLTPDS